MARNKEFWVLPDWNGLEWRKSIFAVLKRHRMEEVLAKLE
jgi:hypothetical protein